MSVNSSKMRREIAFVKALLAGKSAYLSGADLFKIELCNRYISLSLSQVKNLASDGVISFISGKVKANSQSKNWLKRKLADEQECFAMQHQNIKIDASAKRVNLNESPLSRLSVAQNKREAFLKPYHVEAGKRFALIYQRTKLQKRISMDYQQVSSMSSNKFLSSEIDISDMAIDARKQMDRALENLPADCASIIIDVCGMEKGLQLVESERGWPARSAKLVLRIGLEQLAIGFGLSQLAIGSGFNRVGYSRERA